MRIITELTGQFRFDSAASFGRREVLGLVAESLMPGRQKSDAKKEAILRAASEEFAERDFHEVLMEDVAARAGVGKGTLYRYFPNKDDLFAASVAHSLEDSNGELADFLTGPGSIEQILTGALTRMLVYFRGRGNLLTLIQRHENRLPAETRARWEERRLNVRDKIRALLDHELASGRLSFADTDLAAQMLLGMFRTAVTGVAPKIGHEEEIAARIVALFLDGVHGPSATPGDTAQRSAQGSVS